MIPNQWYVILTSREVRKGKLVGVKRLGENLVVWRDGKGELGCLIDACVHRKVQLSYGKLAGDTVECPFHGFRYDRTGKVVEIPANGKCAAVGERYRAKSYPVREKYGFVWIFWGDRTNDLPEIPFFENLLDPKFKTIDFKDYWNAHYSRIIENQLDVVHLPFVHYNTIGRGHQTLVNGPLLTVIDENRFEVRIDNRTDDCSEKPKKPDEVGYLKDAKFRLEFRFPHLWQNHIDEKLRILIAFVPVDDEHTILYLRNYQKIVRLPLLAGLFNLLMKAGDYVVAHQDRRVVETQRPFPSSYKSDEKLIQGDHPIVHYRKRREELKNAR